MGVKSAHAGKAEPVFRVIPVKRGEGLDEAFEVLVRVQRGDAKDERFDVPALQLEELRFDAAGGHRDLIAGNAVVAGDVLFRRLRYGEDARRPLHGGPDQDAPGEQIRGLEVFRVPLMLQVVYKRDARPPVENRRRETGAVEYIESGTAQIGQESELL